MPMNKVGRETQDAWLVMYQGQVSDFCIEKDIPILLLAQHYGETLVESRQVQYDRVLLYLLEHLEITEAANFIYGSTR